MSVSAGPKVTSDGIIYSLDPANKAHVSANVHPNPIDLFTWCNPAGKAGLTILQDSNLSPVGNRPMRLTTDGSSDPRIDTHGGGGGNSAWDLADSASSGETWTVSVYAKGDRTYTSGQHCEIYVFGADSNAKTFVDGGYVDLFNTTFLVTPEWKRFHRTVTFTDSRVRNIHARLDGPQTNNSGSVVWFDGMQVEKNDNPGPFNSNTSYPSFTSGVNTSHIHTNDGAGFNSEYVNDFEFDSDQFRNIEVPSIFSNTCDGTNNFSISVWFNTSTIPESTSSIYSNTIFSLDGERSVFIVLGDSIEGSRVSARCNVAGAWVSCGPSDTNSIEVGKWYNYVVTYNSLSGFVGYLNGKQVSTTSNTGAIAARSTKNQVGCLSDSPTNSARTERFFSGQIGPIKVYDKVLTASEVKNDYIAVKGRYNL